MKIATAILTHANRALTHDTLDSIRTWVGDRTLVLVDEVGWDSFKTFKIGRVEKGFLHGHDRSPYRNSTLALKKLYEYWPDSDWFLYTEFDVLFLSSAFKKDLIKAEALNAWVVGFDLRRFDFKLPLLQNILNQGNIKYSYYFLGCCQFFHRKFLEELYKINFFDNFLEKTKDFQKGFFPDYERWAFEEELWATMAAHLGGNLYELSCWKGKDCGDWQSMKPDSHMMYSGIEHDLWRGKFHFYPVRNAPDICVIDIKPEASIAHPSKMMDEIRLSRRNERKRHKQLAIF